MASIDTYLKYAEAVGLTPAVSRPVTPGAERWKQRRGGASLSRLRRSNQCDLAYGRSSRRINFSNRPIHFGFRADEPQLRQYDVFIETTTQMLATPKLHERLLLALEAISNSFGHRQAAIAIINERDAELRIRAAIGFDVDLSTSRVEMPLDSSAARARDS